MRGRSPGIGFLRDRLPFTAMSYGQRPRSRHHDGERWTVPTLLLLYPSQAIVDSSDKRTLTTQPATAKLTLNSSPGFFPQWAESSAGHWFRYDEGIMSQHVRSRWN
jgi:hypothetical protein